MEGLECQTGKSELVLWGAMKAWGREGDKEQKAFRWAKTLAFIIMPPGCQLLARVWPALHVMFLSTQSRYLTIWMVTNTHLT